MSRMRLPKVAAFTLQMLLFWLPVAGAQETATEVGTDIGTLYRDEAALLYKAPGYSRYAGRNCLPVVIACTVRGVSKLFAVSRATWRSPNQKRKSLLNIFSARLIGAVLPSFIPKPM